jgi:hypothetical protein
MKIAIQQRYDETLYVVDPWQKNKKRIKLINVIETLPF